MAESMYSDGQNQQVPSEFYDSGRPPTLVTPNLSSPLSQTSGEELDLPSPDSTSASSSRNAKTIISNGSPQQEKKMDSNSLAVGGDRLNKSMDRTSNSGNDSIGPGGDGGSPRRYKHTRPEIDVMKLSAISGDGYTDSLSSSRPASAASSRSPFMEREAERRLKEREKEERVRMARQRMAEERQRKLIELKEQQRIAQENRERQLELRRKKIEELRKREEERRAAVEERRLRREATERSKREAILQRASERMTRYEAWKTGGRKGGSGRVSGFGSRTPRDICTPSDRPKRSSSHSALIRRSPNSSDCGYMSPQRRAISACSSVRRHCCVDINRTGQNPGLLPPSKHLSVSTSVLYHKRNPEFSSTGGGLNNLQPGSLLALNTIPEGRRSFVAPTSSPPQRPKSTVALNTTTSGTTVKMRETKSPRKPRPNSVASSMPSFISTESPKTPSQRSLSTDRLAKEKRLKETIEEEKPKSTRPKVKFSRQSLDRLSAPKQIPKDPMTTSVEMPKREPIIKRSPRKAYSTTNLAMTRKSLPANLKVSKETPARMSRSSAEVEDKKVAVVKPSPSTGGKSTPSAVPPIRQSLTPTSKLLPAANTTTPKAAPTPVAAEETKKDEQKDVEDYKARLAEHRRLAREKAEKEAEEERKRQEKIRLEEEERQRLEEEEQRKMEEEALRIAEEARKIEEERLQKAIEAEEKRKEEEAQRLEEERIAKELADQKAQEEAERMERERIERAKKEEVERVERKKRLEMIMKRVKTDPGQADTSKTESPMKSVTGSPSKSSDSLHDTEEKKGQMSNANSEEEVSKLAVDAPDASQFQTPDKPADGEKPRFRSPLLQQMAENKSDSPSNDRPKFKSPLLQNLLGKTKVGARMSLEKANEESRAGEILNSLKQKDTLSFSSSQSLTNLSQASDSLADKEALEKNMSKSVFNISMKDEDRDIDTTESENSSVIDAKETDAGQHSDEKSLDEDLDTTIGDQLPLDNGHSEITDQPVHTNGYTDHTNNVLVEIGNKNGQVEDDINNLENGIILKGGADSGVLMDLGESGTSLQSIPVNGIVSHDLIDSSISMQSVDSNVNESVTKELPSQSNEFEEFIDLSVPSKNVDLKTSQLTDSLVKEATNDLLNFNSEEQENRTPFIAFEDNSNRKQDVPDLLS